PPGQGERYQYWEPETERRLIGGCTTEHTHAGLPFTLQGASIARVFLWDAMRAIDYLVSRPEVDPDRIAVTGNSGGGTQTSFLMEGSLEAGERARRIYALYAAEEKVGITVTPSRHEYAPPLRQATANWFRRYLQGREPDFRTGEPETLPDEALRCTPAGQVL